MQVLITKESCIFDVRQGNSSLITLISTVVESFLIVKNNNCNNKASKVLKDSSDTRRQSDQ